MEENKKVYVVGQSKHYANWLKNFELTSSLENADLILFTGGEDVDPSVYNEERGRYTNSNIHRDLFEKKFFNESLALNKPMLGICRGSQLLCALSGGRLVQHQENPDYIHECQTFDDKRFLITSTHHQAQYPYDMDKNDYKLIAWTENISKMHLDGNNKEISDKSFKEAEIVFYPKTKCLGIQGHPESMHGNAKYQNTFDYLNNLIVKLLDNTL